MENRGKDDCVCQGAPGFQMNGDPDFANRKIRFWEDSLLFDGYSVWFESGEEWKKTEGNFTASFCIAPLEYAETPDGLFSCFDREKSRAFMQRLQKTEKSGQDSGRERRYSR